MEIDAFHRREQCAAEIAECVSAGARLADALQSRNLPIRVTHNDTKPNNLLFDRETEQPICVIDWDTTQPGFVAHDFGDMVRSMGSAFAEDESDMSRVKIVPERLSAIKRGYLSATRDWLTKQELDTLMLGAETIIFEQAIR